MDKDFWKWYAENPSRALEGRCAFAEAAWLEATRRADKRAREECYEIVKGYAFAEPIACAIRATIPEDK